MPELDNPQGESVVQTVTESSAAPQAPGSTTVEPAKEASAPAEVDVVALQKELEKVRMEANLHKNKVEKYESAKEEARKAELSEVERLKEELSRREQADAQREAKEFRNNILEDYLKDSPAALKAAKALIAKNPGNLVWGEGLTEEEARIDLQEQLDALKEVVGETAKPAEESTPSTRSNNPAYRGEQDPDRAALVMEARKTGDWSKLIGTIPSVQSQVKRLDD